MRRTIILAAILVATVSIAHAQTRPRAKVAAPAPQQTAAPAHADGTYCQRYGRNGADVVLLGIDRSIDRVRPVDRAGLNRAFQDALGKLEAGDRVQIFTIYDHPTSRQVLFDDCYPGRPRSAWTTAANPIQVDHDTAEFHRLYQNILANIGATATQSNAAHSAIASTIAGVSTEFQGKIKHLVLMTDLLDTEVMEMTPTDRIDAHKRGEKIDRIREAAMLAHLNNASVTVFGFGRSDSQPYPAIDQVVMNDILLVWQEYFRRSQSDAPLFVP